MELIEGLYLACSATLVVAGLTMVGMAAKAYVDTRRRAMILLAVGFSLIVAAVMATTISAFLSDFRNPRLLLTVNNVVMTTGFLFVVASLLAE